MCRVYTQHTRGASIKMGTASWPASPREECGNYSIGRWSPSRRYEYGAQTAFASLSSGQLLLVFCSLQQQLNGQHVISVGVTVNNPLDIATAKDINNMLWIPFFMN